MFGNRGDALEPYYFEIDGYTILPLEKVSPGSVAHFHQRNRMRIEPVSPKRTEYYYTPSYWKRACKISKTERKMRTALRWVCVEGTTTVAQFALDRIVFGVFRSAILSYAVDREVEGSSIMFECLKHVINHAFETLDLHRIEAHHVPENTRSAAILKRLGFEQEGYAKQMLNLDGRWKDHVLNALINPRHI
jgi:ribosomal-protein-alanine N-acetyltransferase